MKLKALSHYNGDTSTRYGDCILLHNQTTLVVYDCGHEKHANAIKTFLKNHTTITQVRIIVSHNDKDHTNGIVTLLDYLSEESFEDVIVYTALYLKSVREVFEHLKDDGRRTLSATKKHILKIFDNIADVVTVAQDHDYDFMNASKGTKLATCEIVGPTESEFAAVVAQAIKDGESSKIDGETVMNAASIQLKCVLENGDKLLLSGDASPEYLHNLDNYTFIQLPHHGQLADALTVFDKIDEYSDSYNKKYLISDNTGSSPTSGGSEKLVKHMKKEKYDVAMNTKTGTVNYPPQAASTIHNPKPQGVKLGEVDCVFGS